MTAAPPSPTASAYAWTGQPPPPIPDALPPVHRTTAGGVEAGIQAGADWILRGAGLFDLLDLVAGDPDALHAAAQRWLAQAAAVRAVSTRLRHGASVLPAAWEGAASAAFGTAMGSCVASLDALAANLAETAGVLNRAGAAAGLAEDLVADVIADAAEWVTAELAATFAADLLTLGFASLAGALAESATLAAFVARATRASAELGETLALLARELHELAAARDAIRAADGLGKLAELQNTRHRILDLELLGATYRVVGTATDAALGQLTGLPIDQNGAAGLGTVVARSLAEEKGVVEAAR